MALPTSIGFDSELKSRVQRRAEVRRLSREALRQETLDAWDEFQTTGQYVSAEEVEIWLSTWGNDAERSAPQYRKSISFRP